MSTKAEPGDSDSLTRRLASNLERLPADIRRFRVAFSGGLDSTVLLYCLSRISRRTAAVTAIHIDHGLHPKAGDWAGHCAAVCERLEVPLITRRIDARAKRGESPEAAARTLRYAAFAELIEEGDCLLTAHHQDDQAETVLLQLLRGAGPHGLAAMPSVERFAAGWHARPWLGMPRDELADYASSQRLQWIEDPSNTDTGLRRNFLRLEILPRLKQYWPAAARTLSRSAMHSASAARLLDTLARQDLEYIEGDEPRTLMISGLSALGAERQANALREWLHRLELPLPSSAHLDRLREDLLGASEDSTPLLAWPGAEVRRYRNLLYAMNPLPPHDPDAVLRWDDLSTPLDLPDGGQLVAHPVPGQGLRHLQEADGDVNVRFRHGGERVRPAGRGGSHALKKLMQDSAIPPWRRDRLPLIYFDDELAAVVGLCVCEGWQAGEGERGLDVEWILDE